MEHRICFLRGPKAQKDFSNLIMPVVRPRLKEETVISLGAVDGKRPVGAVVMEIGLESARLLSIAVAQDCRRQGIASALLRQCVRLLRRTSIQTLSGVIAPEYRQAAALFEAFGMTCSDAESAYYRVSLADAGKQAILRGTSKAQTLETVSELKLRDYLRREFPGNAALWRSAGLDPKLSQVLVEQGEITACLLVERGKALSISWLSSRSRERLAILYLLRGMLAQAQAAYPPETEVEFTTYEPSVARLADGLLPGAKKSMVQEWELADGDFRLTDTTPTGWEEDPYVGK